MLTVGKLKELLKNVPDNTEIVMYLEIKDGAYEITSGKHITSLEKAPYDGNSLIEICINQTNGVFVLSNC